MEPLDDLSAIVLLLKSEPNDATTLKKPEYLPSKGYLIFDRIGDSTRVFCHSTHEPSLEWQCFHETLASGITAYENVKATRALSSPLCSLNFDVRCGIVSSTNIDVLKNNNLSGSKGSVNPRVEIFKQAQDCLLPMGITSENVVERYGVSRQDQDQATVESHRHATVETTTGKFKDEIIHVETKIVEPKTGDKKLVRIFVDDGIRPTASLSDLAKLKPAFKKGGSTIARNSSQVSDDCWCFDTNWHPNRKQPSRLCMVKLIQSNCKCESLFDAINAK